VQIRWAVDIARFPSLAFSHSDPGVAHRQPAHKRADHHRRNGSVATSFRARANSDETNGSAASHTWERDASIGAGTDSHKIPRRKDSPMSTAPGGAPRPRPVQSTPLW